ncbi:MAG: UvrD-helicase domain-containing protein [Christensenellaceae bacterium]|jgi:superfamily I DNA/RNA helicase|nr:UvrD-helicase domain-containing protein [Christensenellaceae bacterium]
MDQNKTTMAISIDFLRSFASLPRSIHDKVTNFISKFRLNPNNPSINFEKLEGVPDKKLYSVRIDDTYRGIVAKQADLGVYLLLWVDHHDEAYEWASRKKCIVNKHTGSIQIYDCMTEVNLETSDALDIFSNTSDLDLIDLGVPDELIPFIRSFKSVDDLVSQKESLPSDAYEILDFLANGFSLTEIKEFFKKDKEESNDDLLVALQNDLTKSSFYVVEGEEELRAIMDEPLEQWRLFLHPSQRKLVSKPFNGPFRVLGGAGTGKTVVALHRAKYLASQATEDEKILFTTFTVNLAEDIKYNLQKICSVDEFNKIEVINIDAWVSRFLNRHGYTYKIYYDEAKSKDKDKDKDNNLWPDAIRRSESQLSFDRNFYFDEWTEVVAKQEYFTREEYLMASRLGRGVRLNRAQREKVWKVFSEYQKLMKEKHLRDIDTAIFECRLILKNLQSPLYSSIIIDEGQDFSSNAYRLIKAISKEKHINDIFIVGDTHQRIYQKKAVLSKCGIDVRGRSSYLRINYRTTEEIRKYAFAILKGLNFDNLDDEVEKEEKCLSLTHGTSPIIKNFKDFGQEFDFIINEIKALEASGVHLKDICLVTRTASLLDDYNKACKAYIQIYEIKRSKHDDRERDGVRLATMHRVKGLEFQYIFIAALNERNMPFSSALDSSDKSTVSQRLISERCLLYVALTRGRKCAYITSYGNPSPFLKSD